MSEEIIKKQDENLNVETDNQNSQNVSTEIEEESPGCLGIGISFWFPIIGLIIYFNKKDEMENASYYLYTAISGIVLWLFIRLL